VVVAKRREGNAGEVHGGEGKSVGDSTLFLTGLASPELPNVKAKPCWEKANLAAQPAQSSDPPWQPAAPGWAVGNTNCSISALDDYINSFFQCISFPIPLQLLPSPPQLCHISL